MSINPLKIFRIGGGRHITRGNYRKNRGETDCIDSFDAYLGGGGAVEAVAVTVGEEGSGEKVVEVCVVSCLCWENRTWTGNVAEQPRIE
ncbi:hypothetical protein Pyn_13184 [Prunus yedoensis var. nudiflora]|uniref:Uncharacterized protein n=1 Tax=Prunus yedoensis var. nudiflora TaxID=2094558 RepID=A0A314UIV5_PRUYE|nr:hypothetical protein Pyn_13184 [Prunus yedoensis var. nudiflora]